MSVYIKAVAVVASYPAMQIVRRDTQLHRFNDDRAPLEYTNIVARDQLAGAYQSRNYGTMYTQFSANTVVSYALEYNEDPIKAYNDCVAKGHQTHWLNACGSMIHNGPTVQETWTLIENGMIVLFEGVFFTVRTDGKHAHLIKLDII